MNPSTLNPLDFARMVSIAWMEGQEFVTLPDGTCVAVPELPEVGDEGIEGLSPLGFGCVC